MQINKSNQWSMANEIFNFLKTAREGFTVKFQTKGWNFCFLDRAS